MNDITSRITDAPDKAAQAYISGEVAAAVSWEPWITNATKSDGHVLVGSDMRPYLIKDVMYANAETLRQKKQELKTLTDAWLLTIEWIHEHPQEAKRIMGDEFGIPEEEMDLIFPKVQYQDRKDNQLAFTKGQSLQSLYALYDMISDVWLEENIITSSDTAEQGLFPDFFIQK